MQDLGLRGVGISQLLRVQDLGGAAGRFWRDEIQSRVSGLTADGLDQVL